MRKKTTLILTSTLFTYSCSVLPKFGSIERDEKTGKPKKYVIEHASESCRLQGNTNLDFMRYE
jgi:hypothetical protein